VLEPVPQRDHHAIAPGHTEPHEAPSESRHLTGEVFVTQPPRAINDGIGGRPPPRGTLEQLGKRHGTSRTLPLFFESIARGSAERASFRGDRVIDEAISGIVSRSRRQSSQRRG